MGTRKFSPNNEMAKIWLAHARDVRPDRHGRRPPQGQVTTTPGTGGDVDGCDWARRRVHTCDRGERGSSCCTDAPALGLGRPMWGVVNRTERPTMDTCHPRLCG